VTRVLVTDAGRGSSVAIIRSLGRRGYTVTAAGSGRLNGGFYSRFAADHVEYPSPSLDARGAAEALVEAVRARQIDLVIPVTDDLIVPLRAVRSELPSGTVVALPPDEALAVSQDKAATFNLAASLGVPIPRSRLVADESEALAAAAGLGWPVVVKPVTSRTLDGNRVEPFAVSYATDAASLATTMRMLGPRSRLLLQEYCPGEGHGVGLLLDHGRVVAAFQHRRLREVPFTGGPSSLRESVQLDPDLFEHSSRLLGRLEWSGLAMVEYKVGPQGPKLMEINGRVWGSLPLAVQSGVDFPLLLADVFLRPGLPEGPPLREYRVGVRSRDVRLELAWIRSVARGGAATPVGRRPARRAALAAALRLAHPRDGFDVLSLHDPLPALVGGIGTIRDAVRASRPSRPS
jgi:predicted ATP-grasp superfamily ATP-dependent carboligase